MEIFFTSQKLSKQFSSEKELNKSFGRIKAKKIALRLQVLQAAANLEELEQISINNNVDLAIEWQYGEQDYPIRNMLEKIGKVVPIYLCLNWNGKAPVNVQDLGYVDTLTVPWTIEELRQKFPRMLTPDKREILKKSEFWTSK